MPSHRVAPATWRLSTRPHPPATMQWKCQQQQDTHTGHAQAYTPHRHTHRAPPEQACHARFKCTLTVAHTIRSPPHHSRSTCRSHARPAVTAAGRETGCTRPWSPQSKGAARRSPAARSHPCMHAVAPITPLPAEPGECLLGWGRVLLAVRLAAASWPWPSWPWLPACQR